MHSANPFSVNRKIVALPSVWVKTLGKACYFFIYSIYCVITTFIITNTAYICNGRGTRQTITAVTDNGRGGRVRRTREAVCRVLPAWHSAKVGLPSVCNQALGKANLCRVLNFCRVAFGKHSANCNFAECSISCTRQSLQHSANVGFPIVSDCVYLLLRARKGLPAWLRNIPGMQFRLHNDPFEVN